MGEKRRVMNTLDLFEQETELDTFSAGNVIFDRGQPPRNMYVIKEGTVEISIGEHTKFTLRHGGIFGEMALIEPGERSATAITKTDCGLIPIDEKRFTFLVQQTPFFAIHVMRILVSRLRKMNEILRQN